MCIFCKIASKEIQSKVLLEDDNFIAILDRDQSHLGHTLVIPKIHSDSFIDCTLKSEILPFASKVIEVLVESYNPKGYKLIFNVNKAGGQEVMHTHLHIIPYY